MNPNIDELTWMRLFTPHLIPCYLIEQIRDREYSVNEFYKYHEINTLHYFETHKSFNPFTHLWALCNKEKLIKGCLWFSLDPLSKDLIIQTFSMDKDYWFGGKAVAKLAEHMKEMKKKGDAKKVYWVTNYPKHSMRYGFKRSKGVLMEYKEEENGEDIIGGEHLRGEHRSTDSSATELLHASA